MALILALLTFAAGSQPVADEPFSFSVIADVPYGTDEIAELEQHFDDHDRYSPADFLAHLGDINAGSESCAEARYQVVADTLRMLAVPGLILPGDNEWIDCSDPDQGWAWWEEHLLGIEADFCGTPSLESQAARPENFAFLHKGVLFIGINLVAGTPSSVVQADIDWINAQFANNAPQARAVVVLAHKDPSGSLKDTLVANGVLFGNPVLYVHGNGHSWEEDPGFFGEPNMLRVQLARGNASNPPVEITVDATGQFALERDPWPAGTLLYNRAPCVEAGADLGLAAGDTGVLDAFAVDDGVPEPASLSISWDQISGPAAASIADPSAATTTASFPAVGTYVLEVTASDGDLTSSDSLQVTASGASPPPEVTIAFIGDQGLGLDSEAVLQLILDEGADAVIHSGDFDYSNKPAFWEAQIDGILGPDFPYFASVGNHDDKEFYTQNGYQDLLEARMNRLGIPWTGDLGVQSTFHYQGILVVLTAAGVLGEGDGFHDLFIRDVLAADDSIWSISSWHKNMADMQVGGKTDSTGWGVYEESRRGGAIIATAHEHSYSRTHLMASLEGQVVASTEEPLVLSADDPATPEDEGRSFAFVAGLGGQSIRNQERDGPWWASIYTSDQGADHGALFGVFNYQGDPRLAYFYFKDISGAIPDEFSVVSGVEPTEPLLVIDDVTIVEGDAGTSDAVFTVTLHAADGQDVTVDYATADDTALAGVDYVATSGSLTFSGSATAQTISVPVNGDGDIEPDEIFSVRLSNPSHGAVADGEALGTILDDDAAVGMFTLTVSADPGGTVSLTPPGGFYETGTVVTLSAVPDAGFAFDSWSGDLTGIENPATLVMDADYTVGAHFFVLPPPGTGATLEEVQTGASSDSSSVSTAAPLTGVAGDLYLAAIAFKRNSDVTGVSGMGLAWSLARAQCAGRSQTGLSIWQARGQPTGNGVVTASLSSIPSNAVISVLRYSSAGALGGVASANSLGVSGACDGGTDGTTYAFALDTSAPESLVYVAAAMRSKDHAPDARFTERVEIYSGTSGGSTAGVSVADGTAGSAPSASVQGSFSSTVDFAVVALEIEQLPAGPFELALTASTGGTATADPPDGPYDANSVVALAATPDAGFAFDSWSGDLTGSVNPATLVMDADKSVTASFAPQYSVTLAPGAGGSIALNPPGGVYTAGSVVVVTATPDAGYLFTGWSGDLTGTTNPETLVVDADKSVGAQFARPTLVVTAGPGGSVDPPGGVFDAGSVVTLTATPDPGFAFIGWSGDLTGSVNPATLVMDADKSVTASFTPLVTLTVSPATGGSVALEPPGGSYALGSVVTLTATPDPGFVFDSWSGDLTSSDNPATLVMDGDRSVGAQFVAAPQPEFTLEQIETGGSTGSASVSTALPLVGVAGELYLVSIASKKHVDVTGVSGLGLAWTLVRGQCSGRRQTGVAVWQARGQPTGDGVVTATLSSTSRSAVIAVSRYSGAGAPGGVASANTLGVSGGCDGGTDNNTYAFDLDLLAANSLVYVAAAMRNKDHIPGADYTEQVEVYAGKGGGSTAGVSVADGLAGVAATVSVDGTFHRDVDWAVVAVEIQPPSGP